MRRLAVFVFFKKMEYFQALLEEKLSFLKLLQIDLAPFPKIGGGKELHFTYPIKRVGPSNV